MDLIYANKNKTKRIHSNSSDSSLPRSPTNKNKKLFFSTNRYEVLSQDDPPSASPSNDNNSAPIQNPTDSINVAPTIRRPPPIFVRGLYNFSDLCTKLIELIGVDNFYCKSSTDRVKIMTTNPESYRSLVHFLKDQKAEFHTFQLKEDKPLRVVIRNLHPTTPTELIKSELEMRLFEVRQVSSVLHKVNKHPLPLFFVDLEPTDHSNDIYNLTSLLHTLIKVEEPYKPKTINQCSNCQDYGHTKSYCGYPARCVRCGAQHMTSDCPNSRDTPPKCALCSGDHPSNYKGCSIYRDLQRRKKPKPNNQVTNNINPKNIHVQETQPVKAPSTHPPAANYTYAQATANSNTNNTAPPPPDINIILASFMNEFKQLINPLITLLTKVSLKSTQEIDDAVNKFTNVIQSAAWEATPTQARILNNSFSIPEHIRILIANKRRARALFQRSRLPSHKQNFNNLANSLKKILAKHKNQLQVNYLTNLSSNKSLWDATKKSLKNAAPNTPLIKPDDSLASSDADKAELLKIHLAETFSPHTEIQTPQNTKLIKQYLDSPLPLFLPTKSFTPNDVKYAIQKYSLKKSPGYDLITAEVARLTYFPQLWKFSIIILFHKPKKPPDLPSSYRPISLLPFFAKIFERLILKRILPCIYSSNVLPNTQFGFRANHSTTHQLHRLVDAISFSLEKKRYCSCIFLDVSQAFDRVWHEGLLYKLKLFLPPSYFLLIKSYLTDRHFQVRFGSSVSNIANINAGVPQGGILSPILYNIYAADQPSTPHTTVAEFADDKAIIAMHDNPTSASQNLQHHLNLLSDWYILVVEDQNCNNSVILLDRKRRLKG
ncbi:hypothetical protein QTP88_018543 [Uroleucon formosanum]